jgi:anthranilate phosphoribosyltransferase
MDIRDYIEVVSSGRDIGYDGAYDVMNRMISRKVAPVQVAGLLVGLKAKGETPYEIAGLAAAMRERCLRVEPDDSPIVDITGTGGDEKGTFNISTAAAIVAAAAGVTVAKSGNRAVSSACGSANVLHELGIKIDGGPKTVTAAIKDVNIGMMFLPLFHPVLPTLDNPRYELGVRTVLDILGPLINPAKITHLVMGVCSPRIGTVMIEAAIRLGLHKVMAVSSSDGLDELSLSGINQIIEWDGAKKRQYGITAEDVGLKGAPVDALKGGSPETNAVLLADAVGGRGGPGTDITALNAGAALYWAGAAKTIKEGVKLAGEAIAAGKAEEKLHAWQEYSRKAHD